MVESKTEAFGADFAKKKLDMPRRRKELEAYLKNYLPELRDMESGTFFDIGCGPGDLLALVKKMGHTVVGLDAPDGAGGMGEAYIGKCREIRRQFGVDVIEKRLLDFLTERTPEYELLGRCVCINARGSLEQCLSGFMVGESHDQHHDCKQLDWHPSAELWFGKLCERIYDMLRPAGVFLVHANGSRSMDDWYDAAIQRAAHRAGLTLYFRETTLIHKWVKR